MLIASIRKTLPDFTLDVDIKCGDGILVLSGPSGAGKTTLLHCIAGLRLPDEGSIRLGDKALFDASRGTNLPPRERGIGYVFQDYALFPHMTVQQNVLYPLSARPRSRKPSSIIAEGILQMLRIDHLVQRYPWQISGGEQQRVALARALMAEPDLLLLDEPWSSLDENTRAGVKDDLVKLQRFWQIPFILVTHDYRESSHMGECLYLIRGRITNPSTAVLEEECFS